MFALTDSSNLAICLQIGVSSEQQYCDVLLLRQVAVKHRSTFNYVAGMVPFIYKTVVDVSFVYRSVLYSAALPEWSHSHKRVLVI